MAQDELLETEPGAELEYRRAEPTNGATCHLNQPDALVVDAQLGVDRSLAHPQSRGGFSGPRRDSSLCLLRQPRGGDVDRLLEEGAFQWIGFVEQRQRLQAPARQQAFERNLETREIALDKQLAPIERFSLSQHDPPRPLPGLEELIRVISADNATAAGESQRFHHNRERNLAG